MKLETMPDFEVQVSQSMHGFGLEHAVGHTPLLPLRKITKNLNPGVQIFAKAEWFNPGGSVKDRPALNIIRRALQEGQLSSGRRLLDSTSGNMGIAYATFGAALGIPVTLAIPQNASPERFKILKALSAELILTDPFEGSDGALRVARDLAQQQPDRYYYANQYNNPANWQAHYLSTGPEVLEQVSMQTGGQPTHFVAGLGTSGTLMGTGKFLQEHVPGIKLVASQPDSPFHGLEGLKHMESAIKPGIYKPEMVDEQLEVRTEDAYEMTRRLAREEGLFVGISSGAAAVAALQLAQSLESGIVVTLFPDSGYKYLSDRFWEATP